jgi:hypothetical protein
MPKKKKRTRSKDQRKAKARRKRLNRAGQNPTHSAKTWVTNIPVEVDGKTEVQPVVFKELYDAKRVAKEAGSVVTEVPTRSP